MAFNSTCLNCKYVNLIQVLCFIICINAGNWVDSAQNRNYWESPCECGIEPPGSISHGVSYVL